MATASMESAFAPLPCGGQRREAPPGCSPVPGEASLRREATVGRWCADRSRGGLCTGTITVRPRERQEAPQRDGGRALRGPSNRAGRVDDQAPALNRLGTPQFRGQWAGGIDVEQADYRTEIALSDDELATLQQASEQRGVWPWAATGCGSLVRRGRMSGFRIGAVRGTIRGSGASSRRQIPTFQRFGGQCECSPVRQLEERLPQSARVPRRCGGAGRRACDEPGGRTGPAGGVAGFLRRDVGAAGSGGARVVPARCR